jgi:alpha-D-xyloside xylohydrolase
MSLPLYVAPGTVLPWGAETERPDYDYADGVTLRVFELADGASAAFVVPTSEGGIAARGTVSRQGKTYTAKIEAGALRHWSLQVGDQRSMVLDQGEEMQWSEI